MTLLMSQFDAQLVAGLLKAARVRTGPAPQEPEAKEFDWKAPSRFTPDQLARLGDFATGLAGAVSAALGDLLRTKTVLELHGVTQHYASELQAWQSQASVYCVALADGQTRCGLVALARSCAAGWVDRSLGAKTGPQEAPRELTSVEIAILLDILGTLAGAFSQACQKAGGKKLPSVSGLLKAEEIEELIGHEAAREYCKIALRASEGKGDPVLTFVLTCDALEGVAGSAATRASPTSAEAVRKAVMAHVEQVPITVRVRLGQAQVAMGELMRLEPGDVLLLDRSCDEPAEVLVGQRVVMSGFPASCEGQYALRIAARAGGAKR